MVKLARRLTLLAIMFVVACVPSMDERRPLTLEQASVDLHCHPEELRSIQIGHRLFRVEGCGRSAVYRVICKLGVASCHVIGGPQWVENAVSAVSRSAAPEDTGGAAVDLVPRHRDSD